MTSTSGIGLRLLGVLAAGTIVIGVVGWPVPAQAHTELVRSSPAEGEVVVLSTDRLVLDFGDDLAPVASDVVVRDPERADVTQGDPLRSGSTLDVRLRLLAPGRHTVSYRVVGQDGHVVAGTYGFTAARDGSPATSAAPVSGEGAPDATTAPVAAGVKATAPAASTSLRWLWPAAGVAGALVLLHALLLRERRAGRRR